MDQTIFEDALCLSRSSRVTLVFTEKPAKTVRNASFECNAGQVYRHRRYRCQKAWVRKQPYVPSLDWAARAVYENAKFQDTRF